ncbi:MAG: hypothetical protein ACLRVN_06065 [Butyricicoccus sp.]
MDESGRCCVRRRRPWTMRGSCSEEQVRRRIRALSGTLATLKTFGSSIGRIIQALGYEEYEVIRVGTSLLRRGEEDGPEGSFLLTWTDVELVRTDRINVMYILLR